MFVIKNNNLQLYEDLVSAVEEGKDYLVLVDDANELSGLHHVLEYLPKAAIGSRHISKLILTVRDYARKQVMQSVMEVIQDVYKRQDRLLQSAGLAFRLDNPEHLAYLFLLEYCMDYSVEQCNKILEKLGIPKTKRLGSYGRGKNGESMEYKKRKKRA